jgi:hypothetical protein
LSFLPFVPATIHFACDGVPVVSRREHQLVNAIAMYGGATMSDPGLIADESGQPVGLMMTVQSPGGPEQPNLGSRFSSIYSGRYIVATKDPLDGSVRQMRCQPDPALTWLAVAASADAPKRVMPVQVFRQIPTEPPTVG